MKSTPMPMHPRFINLTGQTFGRLQVVSFAKQEKRKRGSRSWWNCLCKCGVQKQILSDCLRSERTKSCGCFREEFRGTPQRTHGQTNTPEYNVWARIKQRCTNTKYHEFHLYGGRGIKICSRWLNSFEAFFRDMGPRTTPQHTVERINNDKGYEPGNCRWATQKENGRNKRNNHRLTHLGQTKCLSEWSEITGIKSSTIRARIKSGWSVENALTTITRIRR